MEPPPAGADPDAGSTHVGGIAGADTAYAVFDDLTDVVVVLDENFDIVSINRFTERLLGYDADAMRGRSITEFLNAEDIVRAFEVVALMGDRGAAVALTPALYDLRRADGTWIPVELNGVTEPAGFPPGHTLVVGRYSGDHALQNQILEMITSDRRDAELIAIVPQFGSWRHPDEQYAVWYQDVTGAIQVTGTAAAVRLATDHPDGDAPWARARRTGEEILVEAGEFPPALRAEAEVADLGACWAVPVADPLHDEPAVLIGWSRTDGPSASVHRYSLEMMGRMLDLILQWRRQREELERAARRDPLTGLVNRAGFFEVLGTALESAPPDTMLGVLYIDLDGFKDVNDAHGHSVGDDVLTEVAHRLAAAVRAGDLLGRLGGDEFAVLCSDDVDVDDLTAVARRIIDDVSEPIAIRGFELRVGASIGIATTIGATLPDQLVDAADRSLYLAKAAGRGRWHLADLEPEGHWPVPSPRRDPLHIDWDRRRTDNNG